MSSVASGRHLGPSLSSKSCYRPDLRWYDLRHRGAVLVVLLGATFAEPQVPAATLYPAPALAHEWCPGSKHHRCATLRSSGGGRRFNPLYAAAAPDLCGILGRSPAVIRASGQSDR